MGIEIKCFATLKKHEPDNADDYPLQAGDTVATVMERLGIPADQVTLMFINSARAYPESELSDGDRLGLFPPVGGG